ncbi:MAG: DsbA family protein [Deltaproteobacteria bacterium]|nr:DsbA family protein [Deltaproteobacteria bacterium]MBN2673972.1 DsbA family protein [Deltaproteobacteria bacterium]
MKQLPGQLTPIFAMLLIGASAFIYLNCASTQSATYISAQDLGKIGQVDVSELTPTELKRFDEIINKEVSPCGNEFSLAQTLLNPNLCPLTPHAAGYVLSLIMEDYNAEEISTRYVQRYASVKGMDIDIANSPQTGAENPSVTVVVFSDFQCPFCAKAAKMVKKVTDAYPDDVRLVFKHFPLAEIHPDAMLGSRAAYAAFRQGKFWEMHDTLFSRGAAGFDPEVLRVMAAGLGLDVDRFEEDLVSESAKSAIEADMALGQKLGVDGTPKIFVNGRVLEGGVNALEDRIREEFLRNKYLKKN